MLNESNPILLSDFTDHHESHYPNAPLHDTPEEGSTSLEGRGVSRKLSLYDRYILDSWWFEFLSWLLATVLLLALLILLGKFKGKSLSEWHSNLSLNTIIAVVSQLVQMVLLVPIASSISQLQWLWYRNRKPLKDISYFQDASTGLMSSLVLLYKRRASLIVWLGVLCMILQVLFGPFAQQALSLPTRPVPFGPNGTISRSLSYDTPLGSEEIGNISPPEVVPEMKLAIYAGLLREGVNPSEVQGSSATGNCTFGSFASMGVCASVEDVTSTIVPDCRDVVHLTGISDDKCSYSVPALREHHPFSSVGTFPGEDYHYSFYMGASMIYVDPETSDTSQSPINDTLIEFYVIYVPDLTTLPAPGGKTNYTGKLAALKGTLSLCAHTYNSSMQFGVTNTTLQGQETHLNWRHGTANNDNNQEGYVASVPGSSDTLFMTPTSLNGLSIWLITSIFNGTVYMPPPTPPPTKDLVVSYGQGVFSTLGSKQVALHLYGSETGVKVTDGVGALSKLLNNVAMSMSNG